MFFRDAFGKKGDFITSPEVSQMFGECIAVWIIHEWKKMGGPLPLQVVLQHQKSYHKSQTNCISDKLVNRRNSSR